MASVGMQRYFRNRVKFLPSLMKDYTKVKLVCSLQKVIKVETSLFWAYECGAKNSWSQQEMTSNMKKKMLKDEFKRYCNTLRNSIITAKKTYYHNLFETASHMRTTWRRNNSLLFPNRSNPRLKLIVNNWLLNFSSIPWCKYS